MKMGGTKDRVFRGFCDRCPALTTAVDKEEDRPLGSESDLGPTPDFYDRVSTCMTRKGLGLPPRDLFASPARALETFRALADKVGEEGKREMLVLAMKKTLGEEALLVMVGEALPYGEAAYCLGQLIDCCIQHGVLEEEVPVFKAIPPAEMRPAPEPTMWPTRPEPTLTPSREPTMNPSPPPTLNPTPPPPAPIEAAVAPTAKQGLSTIQYVILTAIATGFLLIVITAIDRRNNPSNAPAPAGGSYSLRWNCAGSSQCASDMGGYSGVRVSNLTYDQCAADLSNFGIQSGGSPTTMGGWCSPG